MVRHSIVLIPSNEQTVRRVCAYVHGIYGKAAGEYICGINSYPHITVAQIEADETEIEKLKFTLDPFVGKEFEIKFKNFYLDIEDANIVWSGLNIVANHSLQAFHQNVVDRIEREGFSVTNKKRDHYWPHLTAARVSNFDNVIFEKTIDMEIFSQPLNFIAEHGVSGSRWRYLKPLP